MGSSYSRWSLRRHCTEASQEGIRRGRFHFPRESLKFFVPNGGDFSEAGNAHHDGIGVDCAFLREVGGNDGEAVGDDCSRLGDDRMFGGLDIDAVSSHTSSGFAKGGGELKDAITVSEDNEAGQDEVVGIEAGHARVDGEEVFVAMVDGDGEHSIGDVATGVGVGGNGFAKLFF